MPPWSGCPKTTRSTTPTTAAKALRQTLEALALDLAHVTPERIQSAISWAKNQLITADRYEPQPGNPVGRIVERVYPAYQARLLQNGAVDFDDLLLHVATLLRENAELRRTLDARYRYILVDEYQDTNLAQYSIVRGAVDRSSEPGSDGRSRPIDLRLARCESEQHPGIRARLSDSARRAAGAKLPQHAAHPPRRRSSDLAQHAPQDKRPVHRKRRRSSGSHGDLSGTIGSRPKRSP